MAYKDILVYLDPTAEFDERLEIRRRPRQGARRAPDRRRRRRRDRRAGGGRRGRDPEGLSRPHPVAGVKAVFVPAEKPGEGDAFTHCVDLIVAPAPAGASRDVVRRGALDRALARLRRADADPAAGLDGRDGRRQRRHRLERRARGAARRPRRHAVPREGEQDRPSSASRRARATCAPRAVMLLDHLEPHGVVAAHLRLDQHRRPHRDRGAVRQPRHPGRRPDRRRRLQPFAALRRPVRRREPRPHAPAVAAGADVALASGPGSKGGMRTEDGGGCSRDEPRVSC